MAQQRYIGQRREIQVRQALSHGPARRVGPPGPLLGRNRAHELVESRLRTAILIGDQLQLQMHVLSLPSSAALATLCRPASSSPFPASVVIPRSPERSPAFYPQRAHTRPPPPSPGLSSRRSAPGSHAGTAALRSAGRPSRA